MTSIFTVTLVSDGIKRFAIYRDPGTRPQDAVIWLHGGNGQAKLFLEEIRPRSNVVDVVPQGSETGDHPGWVNAWEAENDIPKGAPDNLVDIRFVGLLEQHVRSTCPSVTRVWLCGFSAGGGLVWGTWGISGAWGKGITVRDKFAGLCIVGKQLRRKPGRGWNWKESPKVAMPFVMVHGSGDKPDGTDPEDNYSWEESYAQARMVNGNTTTSSKPDTRIECLRRTYNIRLKCASGGLASSARYLVEGMGHEWVNCTEFHTDDLVMERFMAYGLGSTIGK